MKVRITRTNYVTRADSRGNGNARLRLPMSAAQLYIDMKEGTKKRDGSFTPLVQSEMYSQLAYTYRSACQIQLIWPNLNHSRQSGLSSSSPLMISPLPPLHSLHLTFHIINSVPYSQQATTIFQFASYIVSLCRFILERNVCQFHLLTN